MPSLKSGWINFEEYLTLLDSNEMIGTTGYHRADWLLATSSAFNCVVRCVKTSSNGIVLSITPFMLKKKGPFRIIGSALRGTYTEFSGPLFTRNITDTEMCEIIKSQHNLVSKGCHYVEWRVKGVLDKDYLWGNSLDKLGYKFDYAPSLLIDLTQSEEVIWASFKGRARTSVRKAEKANLKATIVEPSQKWIEEYYEILTHTFGRQGLAVPHPLSFFRKIEELSKLGFIRCVEVRLGCEIGAAAIFVQDETRMMYLSGVSSKEGMRLAASSLVQWCAMKAGAKDGILEYDMGGLGIESIDNFKRSFGGSDVRHLKWVYRSNSFKLLEPLAIWLSKKGLIGLN